VNATTHADSIDISRTAGAIEKVFAKTHVGFVTVKDNIGRVISSGRDVTVE